MVVAVVASTKKTLENLDKWENQSTRIDVNMGKPRGNGLGTVPFCIFRRISTQFGSFRVHIRQTRVISVIEKRLAHLSKDVLPSIKCVHRGGTGF